MRAGYHQVIVTPATQAAIAAMKQTHPERPLWRISSTLFHHVASDVMLRPLDGFVRMLEEQEQEGTSKEEVERVLRVDYEPILTGHFVERELQGINLKR